MWRPFAGSFVDHSLDSFIVKHEKGKSNLIYTPKPERQHSHFKLSEDDVQRRMDLFRKLQEKVICQRAQIKINDSLSQQKIEKKLRYKRKERKGISDEWKVVKALSGGRRTENSDVENDSKIRKVLAVESKTLQLPLIKRKSLE